jgi:hypothetical protein
MKDQYPGKIYQIVQAKDGSSINNVTQQVFIGEYEDLREAYINPWPVFERVQLDHFSGREWLLDAVDKFIGRHDRGYFILEADAGLGKTTFMAWLVKKRGYIHHFCEQAPGVEYIGRSLKNLASQLIVEYHLRTWEVKGVLPGAAANPDFIHNLLQIAANQRRNGEKIILVVDAVDEAGVPYNQNILGLPKVLPEGVYLLVSQRTVPLPLEVDIASTPREIFSLSSSSSRNMDDMRSFLEKAVLWEGIARTLVKSRISQEQFIKTMLMKCQGVWIYLHFVINEIERGDRSLLNLDALPEGIWQYYARYWGLMRKEDELRWDEVHLPLLSTLAASQEPASISQILAWTDIQINPKTLYRLLNERWKPFLAHSQLNQEHYYRFYHATVVDFFHGLVQGDQLSWSEKSFLEELKHATREAHWKIAHKYLEDWGGLTSGLKNLHTEDGIQIDDDYGLHHLVFHLSQCDSIQEIEYLLCIENQSQQNLWYLARESEGDISGYLADISLALNYSIHQRDIPLQCRYLLFITSINNLSDNTPALLMKILVEKGVWKIPRALSRARQKKELKERVEALSLLIPLVDDKRREILYKEILELIKEIPSKGSILDLVIQLVHIYPSPKPDFLFQETLALFPTLLEGLQKKFLQELEPYLPDSFIPDFFKLAWETNSTVYNRTLMTCRLPDPERHYFLMEILSELKSEEKYYAIYPALRVIKQHLCDFEVDKLLENVALKALDDIRQKDHIWGVPVRILADLFPTFSISLQQEVLQEILLALHRSLKNKVREAPKEIIYTYRNLLEIAPPKLLPEIFKFPDGYKSWIRHYALLVPLLHRATAKKRKVLLKKILADILDSEYKLSDNIEELLPYLTPNFRKKILAAVKNYYASADKTKILMVLARVSMDGDRESLLVEAFESAKANYLIDKNGFDSLLPYLSKTQLIETLRIHESIGDELSNYDGLFNRFYKTFPPSEQSKAWHSIARAAQEVGDESQAISVLEKLAPVSAKKILLDMLSTLSKLKEPIYRLEGLIALSPYLPKIEQEQSRKQAIGIVKILGNRVFKHQIIAKLLPQLVGIQKENLLSWSLTFLDNTDNLDEKAQVLSQIAPSLSADQFREYLSEILFSYGIHAERILKPLVPFFPQEFIRPLLAHLIYDFPDKLPDWYFDVFEQSREINLNIYDSDINEIVSMFAPRIAELGDSTLALEIILERYNDPKMSSAMISMARFLPPDIAHQTLEKLDEIPRTSDWLNARVELVFQIAKMGEPLLALNESNKIPDYLKPQLFNKIAPLVENQADRNKLLVEAFHLIYPFNMGDIDLLANLMDQLAELPQKDQSDIWQRMLGWRGTTQLSRSDYIQTLYSAAPVIESIGGCNTCLTIFHTLQDIYRWFP